ncbi:MAG: hypothetical protein SOT81_09975 [Treponema sp.]|nr:hypothetical protein [Treponema sp.]
MEKTDNQPPLPDEKKSKHLPLLLRLTRRVCVFLFLLLAGFVIFYISGSYQNFLDSNISLILKAVACTSIALFFFSAVSVLETFFFALKDRRILILFNLFFFVFTLLSSVVAGIFSLVVNKLSEGIVF